MSLLSFPPQMLVVKKSFLGDIRAWENYKVRGSIRGSENISHFLMNKKQGRKDEVKRSRVKRLCLQPPTKDRTARCYPSVHPPAPAPTPFGSRAGCVQKNVKSGPTLHLPVGTRGARYQGITGSSPLQILATPYGVLGSAHPTALPGTTIPSHSTSSQTEN